MLCRFVEEREVLEEASLEGQDTDSSRHCFVEWSAGGQDERQSG